MNDTSGYLDSEIYSVDLNSDDSDNDAYSLSKVKNDLKKQAVIKHIVENIQSGDINVDRDLSFAVSPDGDGLLVTIPPTIKEIRGTKMTINPMRRQYFLKGFINSPMTDEFRNTAEYKNSQKLQSAMIIGQPLDVSNSDGVTRKIQPAIVVDDKGNKTIDHNNLIMTTTNRHAYHESTPISKQEAMRYLKEKDIVDEAIRYGTLSFYNSDGTYKDNKNIDVQLDNVVKAAMLELYPNESSIIANAETLGYDVENEKSFIQQKYDEMMAHIKSKIIHKLNNN